MEEAVVLPEDALSFPDIQYMGITTDKTLYHSKELLKIQIDITSRTSGNGLQLAVYGLMKSGKPLLSEVIALNLTKGNNLLKIGYELPSCNSCSGLHPGNYSIAAELYYQNEILNSTSKTIRLEQ